MISLETAQVFRMNRRANAFLYLSDRSDRERSSSGEVFVVTTGFGFGHLAATIYGHEQLGLIKKNHDAAVRDSLCAFLKS
jgi:hypothetical protein